MKLNEIKKLAEIMNGAGISKLEVSEDGFSLKLEMGNAVSAPSASCSSSEPSVSSEAVGIRDASEAIKAPLVGTVYLAPNPESPAFVKEGDRIKKDEVVCIIESMKMMNEITADRDCVIKKICVADGDAVEYNQQLFIIE